jgi:hypothetical protein
MNWLAPPSLSIETSRSRLKRLGKQRRFAGDKNEAIAGRDFIIVKQRITIVTVVSVKTRVQILHTCPSWHLQRWRNLQFELKRERFAVERRWMIRCQIKNARNDCGDADCNPERNSLRLREGQPLSDS